jgi:hypothetical protein
VSSILKAYIVDDTTGYTIEPCTPLREWMDATPGKGAYHCMPLTIANQMGWVIPCPTSFSVAWNGKPEASGLTLRFPEREDFWKKRIFSLFGNGILTFGIPWVFRTESNWGLMVRGPTNWPKDNAVPLDGLVETDWAPYTFTMNWKIVRRGSEVWFKQGEPICMIFPFPMNSPEDCQPSYHSLDEDPQLREEYAAFRAARDRENLEHAEKGGHRAPRKYFRGRRPDGTIVEEHRVKYKLKAVKPVVPPAGQGPQLA